jgi:hypothetical protein
VLPDPPVQPLGPPRSEPSSGVWSFAISLARVALFAVSGGKQRWMGSPHSHTASSPPPTEEKPETGVVGLGDVVLSAAEHFVGDDGVHVIRSLEFDVSTHAEDVDSATTAFVDNAEDYCSYLADLAGSGRATAHELESLALLVKRLRALREREREEAEDLAATLLRKVLRKNPPTPVWRPQTTQTTSAPRSND